MNEKNLSLNLKEMIEVTWFTELKTDLLGDKNESDRCYDPGKCLP